MFNTIHEIFHVNLFLSGRNSTAPGSASKKRPNRDDDEDDLTKDMDDPSPETNITEVQLSKQCKSLISLIFYSKS